MEETGDEGGRICNDRYRVSMSACGGLQNWANKDYLGIEKAEPQEVVEDLKDAINRR